MAGAEKDQRAPLARSLGWFSAGLGLAQLAAPGTINRLVGVDDSGAHRALMRVVGVRELAAGAGILGRARPAAGLWARVAGDAMDVAMLGAALRANGNRRGRVALATASVVAVTAADVVASTRTSRSNGSGTGEHPMHAKATTTVNLPADEVYQYWRDLEHLPEFMDHLESVEATDGPRSHWVAHGPAGTTVEWDAEIVEDVPGELIAWRSLDGADVANTGSVRFVPASRDQGTEVTVELSYAAPGGAVGSTVAKLLGEEPALQVKDDLRRFKQVLETGEILLSDGTPGGTRALGQLRQRPGQPAG
jgi:uncharacterized membrane protein